MKRVLFIFSTMLLTLPAFAQEVGPKKSFLSDPFNDPMLPFYLVMAFTFVVILLVMWVAVYMIRVLNILTEQAAKENAEKAGVVYKPEPSWWDKLVEKLNSAVPVEKEGTIELDHNYDGIKELDNHLPPWWKWLFYGTIAFSVVYIVVFHFSDSLPLQDAEYQQEVAMAEEQARKFYASQPQASIDVDKLEYNADAAIIEKGKAVFMDNNCGSCHRNDGGGNTIGPNLTDDYWLHGSSVKEVFSTVKDGVVDKGMPAWGKALSPQEVRDVTFFILSLRGTNPENAKAPQGELVKTEVIKVDSVNAQASLQ